MAGKVWQTEPAIPQNRGGRLSFGARNARENKFYRRLFMQMENYSISRYSQFPCLCAISSPFYVGGACRLPMSLVSSDKFWSVNTRRRIQGICECYLSSSHTLSSWIQSNQRDRLGVSSHQCQSSKHAKFGGIRSAYKSNEDDITGADVNSLKSSEGAGEVVLGEENLLSVSPWWQQFPKRWVIVLLCFFAFLLCNMDRVSSSLLSYLSL